jgi:hypothetical protein
LEKIYTESIEVEHPSTPVKHAGRRKRASIRAGRGHGVAKYRSGPGEPGPYTGEERASEENLRRRKPKAKKTESEEHRLKAVLQAASGGAGEE